MDFDDGVIGEDDEDLFINGVLMIEDYVDGSGVFWVFIFFFRRFEKVVFCV